MDQSFIVEAESMFLDTYRIEANSSASGGQLISLVDNQPAEIGTANFVFDGVAGEYNLVVGYYDENDGVSQLEVTQNDNRLDIWNLDQDFPSDLATATTATTRTIATGIEVNQGDNFTIVGREDFFEGVRVDYVEFSPVSSDPSVLSLSNNIFEVDENAGEINIPVVRTGNLEQTVSVNYQTFAETAAAGEDFTNIEGTLTFAPGEATQDIKIEVIDDQAVDPEETFTLTIDNVTGNGTLDAPRTARITVNDDETLADAVVLAETEGNTQVSEAGDQDNYTIALGSQPNSNVTVDLINDTQVSTDVESLSFTPENWNEPQTITVSAVEDELPEGDHQGVISHNVSSEDPIFDGFALNDLTVKVLDNDLGAFVLETFASGLNQPTAIDWSPDGSKIFVAQQDGVVRLVENGSLADMPFIDISPQVNNTRDRGLLGIAVHPDFANQPYVYLAYTYDPPEVFANSGLAGEDGNGNRPSRVIRVEADPSTNFTTALADSEVVIVGKNSTWSNISRPDGNSTNNFEIPPSGITADGTNIQDYLATDSESHSIGALRFGTDGSLFISNGDGTSYNEVDPRTVRVQDLDNLSGKILRVDPLTGEGLADNPFFDGDRNSNRSKVYSYGLRNPFRFTINPNTNEPYIGDVGWTQWEEINTARGANFGWPYYEGGNGTSIPTGGYQELPEAQAFYDSGEAVTSSLYARNHSDGAIAIIVGDFYTGDTFPDLYDNALFYSDFGDSTVRYLTFEESGVEVNTFQDNISGLTQISTGVDGNLYGVDHTSGQIISWRFDPTLSETIDNRSNQAASRSRRFAPDDFMIEQSQSL